MPPTAEQLKNRELAVANIAQGLPQNTGIGDTAITVDGLQAPVAPLDVNTPQEFSIFPVGDLDTTITQLKETVPESQAQGLTEQLRDLNRQLIGESAFRAGKETEQGLIGLQRTQTDLSARLKAIQNEAQAIPLQLQQEAAGRGITRGGLQPLQTARLRTNAIQALGISSLLEASRGNITLAQDLVDRAVAQKFDPIRERINATTRNLNLILQSPDFTRAEKNRAQAQLDIQNENARRLDEQEAKEKAIRGIAITAAENQVNSVDLERIQSASSQEEALRIASEVGAFKEDATIDGVTTPEEPLSINKIEQFRRSYGWTPPFGFTQSQLLKFMADNPNASPEQLEAGAKSLREGTKETIEETPETITEFIKESLTSKQLKSLADRAGVSSVFKFKTVDIKNYLNSIQDQIQEAIDSGFSREEILEFLTK